VTYDWLWLLRECNLKSYDFHALVRTQCDSLENYCQGTTESFCAELGDDSREFLRRLEKSHRTILRQQQKSRKMERELGPLQLEIDCRDSDLLEQSIQWKREQYKRTNILDLFTPQWARDLLRNLHGRSNAQARGIVSVLRAGDHVVATHIGMIDGSLLHYWFPSYNTEFARYSPGTALFKEIVRASSDHGIDCIDMGYGEQPYKRKQTDTITTVAHGCVTPSRVYRQWKRATKAAGSALKKVPMKEQLKYVLRTIQPTAGISKLE
jgi:CelD/BcsL family acetyltransferase involved in cellulose biosynthesis